jgi:hypothetical protein
VPRERVRVPGRVPLLLVRRSAAVLVSEPVADKLDCRVGTVAVLDPVSVEFSVSFAVTDWLRVADPDTLCVAHPFRHAVSLSYPRRVAFAIVVHLLVDFADGQPHLVLDALACCAACAGTPGLVLA